MNEPEGDWFRDVEGEGMVSEVYCVGEDVSRPTVGPSNMISWEEGKLLFTCDKVGGVVSDFISVVMFEESGAECGDVEALCGCSL